MVTLLIEHGADVNADPPDGMSALMRALDQGHVELAQLLLESGVEVNAVDSDMARSALHTASLRGWPDAVELLLDHGADYSLEDAYGMTALGYAGKYGHRDVAEMLTSTAPRRRTWPRTTGALRCWTRAWRAGRRLSGIWGTVDGPSRPKGTSSSSTTGAEPGRPRERRASRTATSIHPSCRGRTSSSSSLTSTATITIRS